MEVGKVCDWKIDKKKIKKICTFYKMYIWKLVLGKYEKQQYGDEGIHLLEIVVLCLQHFYN